MTYSKRPTPCGIPLLISFLALSACGGDGSSNVGSSSAPHTIGGTVSGLEGSGLVLADNGGNDTPVSTNGSFTFSTALAGGGAYNVTVAVQPANPPQICTIAKASGTVGASDVSTVDVTCTNTYSVVGYVSGLTGSGLALSYNGGAAVPVTRNGSLIFAGGVAIGTAYSVSIAGQPTNPAQTCVVSGGSGAIGMANAIVSVSCPQAVGRLAYVSSTGNARTALPGSISVYSIDPSSGALTVISGSTVSAGPTATALQLVPHTSFAWSLDIGQEMSLDPLSSVYDYTVDPSTGLLTPVPASPFDALDSTNSPPVCAQSVPNNVGGSTQWVSFGLSGTFGYATNLPNQDEAPNPYGAAIWPFTIDPLTGAPSLVPGSNLPGGLCNVPDLEPVTVDPSGRFAYTSAGGVNPFPSGATYGFTIDAQTGGLTPVPGSPYSIAGNGAVVIDPAGRFAYVLGGAIYAYTIDPSSGALTAVSGSPFSFAATSMVIAPNRQFAYLLNAGGIYLYSIGPAGALTPASASPAALLTRPTSFTIDPSGQFAYVVAALGSGSSQGVYAFTINPSSGALSSVAGSPFAVASSPGYTSGVTVIN